MNDTGYINQVNAARSTQLASAAVPQQYTLADEAHQLTERLHQLASVVDALETRLTGGLGPAVAKEKAKLPAGGLFGDIRAQFATQSELIAAMYDSVARISQKL
jgi:hypothetical protein